MILKRMTSIAGVALFCALTTGAAQEDDTTSQQIGFSAKILPTEQVGQTDIVVSGHRVLFRLYYVDAACSRFDYTFSREKNVLAVRRVTTAPDKCDKGSESMYGVEVQLDNVPDGKYLLELRSAIDGREDVLYHDVAVVGHPVKRAAKKARP